MLENIEFEEKVDIDDLVLPSEPMKLAEIEIKEEPVEEKEQVAALESDHDKGKKSKLKMEESILKLYKELDKEKYENSPMDIIKQRRSLKIKQFVEKIVKYDSLKGSHEVQPNRQPFSCKFCDQSFLEVHEVKEHIKVHESISEVKGLRSQVKSLKTQVEELEAKLKSSQSKLAFETRL